MNKNGSYGLMKKENIEFFGNISFVMLVLYFLDILLLGTGTMTKIGPLSTRILFFALAGLFSLPLLLQNLKTLLRQPYVICVVVFMVWVIICAVRGVMNGNSSSIIKTDLFGYLNFCILPTALCVLNSEKRRSVLIKVIVAVSVFMAAAAIVLSFFAFFPNQTELYQVLQSTGIVAITVMDGVATRVFCHTASRYFLVAYMFVLAYLLNTQEKKKTIAGLVMMALLIIGIFLSYSRAPYAGSVLAVGVFFVVLLVKKSKQLKRMACLVLVSAVIAVAGIGTLSLLQGKILFEPAIYRVLLSVSYEGDSTRPVTRPSTETTEATNPSDEATEPSDEATEPTGYDTEQNELDNLDVRQYKLDFLYRSISKNPVFGNGLGAAIDIDNGYVEYTYHDIVNKQGFLGLLLFLAPFFLNTWYLLGKKWTADRWKTNTMELAAYAGIVYFLFIAYFNPCMNTTVGISCYVLSMVIIGGKREMKSDA